MTPLADLRRRKLAQWLLAYAAGAWVLLQVLSLLIGAYHWPDSALRIAIGIAVTGFFMTAVLAWYHGERGMQRATRAEIASLAVIAVIGALGIVLGERGRALPEESATAAVASAITATPAKASAANSIAVLPFVDMSQARDQEYFSDGLSEELLNLLAQVPQLRVIARTSSFSFKGKDVDVATIARTLDVGHVLEGSVRKSGNTLRITAQLVRASDSSQLWSQTFDRELTDVFKVQDEIAAAVVAALKVKLLPDQHLNNPYRSANTEAYNQYLLGKEFYNRQTPADLQRSKLAFERAIALDPGYGAAHAGLAVAAYFLADMAGDRASKQSALDIAEQAVAKAPQLAEAYAARGTTRLSFFRDWNGARADFEQALQLNPASTRAQIGYYRLLMALGRHAEAVAAARAATTTDPLALEAWTSFGRALYAQGEHAAAQPALARALEIAPDSIYAGFAYGMNELMRGNPQQALDAFRKSDSVYRPAGIAMAEHTLGHARESQQALDQAIASEGTSGAYQIAQAYAWRGETDKAFEWLDVALVHNDGGLTFLKSDLVIAKLAHDPRFAVLLEKMGLPE